MNSGKYTLRFLKNIAILCDKHGKILDIFSPQSATTHKNFPLSKGKLITEVLPKKLASKLGKKIKIAVDTKKTQRFEFQTDCSSEIKYLEIFVNPNANEKCLVFFYDISNEKKNKLEIKRYVEELHYNKIISVQKAKELALINEKLNQREKELQKINANKDKFFSIISHDLRSPFTSLLGFSEFLLSEVDELSKEEIKEFAENIYKSASGTFALLENLLQWSRLQTSNIEFVPEMYSLTEQLNRVCEIYRVNALQKNINLITEIEDGLQVYADQNMVETVMRNLLSNAIKFTPRNGSITVTAKNRSKDVEVKVADTGIGIEKEKLQKLFIIGENVTSEGTENEKGTGLGLILCKEFVENNNGKLTVKSKAGKGTEFKFTLPKKGKSKLFHQTDLNRKKLSSPSVYKFSK